ncbi:MAG: lytic transglycosylase domain-containing protein, partial [Terracidiphilus sp.]
MRETRLVFLAVAAALAMPVWAAERVTLRNGFELRCDHHTETDGRVRLFLSHGEDNYIEMAAGEIGGVETVPDPPPAATDAQAAEPPRPAHPSAGEAQLTETDLREMLTRAGRGHHLDVDLLASLVKAESGGNARARSRAGAVGLMQLMPATAAELGVKDRTAPEENVEGGSAYLDTLLGRYHENLALALAAYNAGPAAVDRYQGIPPYAETRAYVARVIHEFNRRVLKREAEARRAAAGERAA